MIISHRHKFIFVKTRKTAGTSIEVHLEAHCGDEDVVTSISPPVEGHRPRNVKARFSPLRNFLDTRSLAELKRDRVEFGKKRKFYNHIPAYRLRNRVDPAIWSSYFKFCVERNPWDKTVSQYYWRASQRKLERPHEKYDLDTYFAEGDYCHNDFIYMDFPKKNVIVDRVLRYENLNEELGQVMGQLGIPWEGSLRPRAKGEARSDRRPYQEILSPEQAAIVERAFAREIALFGYRFQP